jgi:DNA primase
MTPGHAHLLHRFTDKVVVNFDQDEAGQKAARKSLDVLVEEGLAVHVVELPEGHDPDSYLKAFGADAYRERLTAAPPYMEWLIRRAAAENDTRTPAGKAAYLAALLPALASIGSAVERAAWLPAVIDRGGLDESAAREELRRAMGGRGVPAAPAPPAPLAGASLLPAEKWLLALILTSAPGVDDALGELADADLAGLRSAEALRAARALYLRGQEVSPAALSAEVEGDEARRLLSEVAVAGSPLEGVTPQDCVKELKRLPLKARMAEIQRDLPKATGEALEALLQEKLQIGRLMAHL